MTSDAPIRNADGKGPSLLGPAALPRSQTRHSSFVIRHSAAPRLGIATLAAALLSALTPAARASGEIDRGDRLLDEGRTAEALEVWEQVRARRPQDTTLLIRIATAQARLGRLADAEATLLQATSIDPRSPKVRYNLAIVYLKQRNFEKALATFQEVLALEETYPAASYFIGLIHEMQGDEKTAEAYYVREVNNGSCLDAWDRLWRLSEKRRAEGRGPQRPAPWKVMGFSLAVLAFAGLLYGLRLHLEARRKGPPPEGFMPSGG